MPTRVRLAAAGAVAVGALVGLIVLAVHVGSEKSATGRLSFAATSPAAAPFGEFSAAHVAVGARCLDLLVALTPAQRVQGLREVRSLARYDGMLFVSRDDSTARFTMADTLTPLDIAFFTATGAEVDHARMVPCPGGDDSTCPQYASRVPYRYALERPTGSSAAAASGSLGSCAG